MPGLTWLGRAREHRRSHPPSQRPPMLMPTLPTSLAELLSVFGPCFTAPTFRTFTALAAGFLAQQSPGTVTGMLVGARLAGVWHHTKAHRFFSAARWSVDQVGLALLDMIVRLLVPPDAPILLAVDDSLFKRCGRKIFGAAWHHDAAAPGRNRTAWGQQLGRRRRAGAPAVRPPPDGVPAGARPPVAARHDPQGAQSQACQAHQGHPRPAGQAHPRPPAGRAGLRPLPRLAGPLGRRRRLHRPDLARRARQPDRHPAGCAATLRCTSWRRRAPASPAAPGSRASGCRS
jgi:hypothetical protein